ncbi:MAG: carboxylating nicotinate-nucleotide diphosphorylase [Nitrospinae bacterium]|nr:carboxylating nicotinate-nucleotide diphosphorylase [Nitrospinota bacterium]
MFPILPSIKGFIEIALNEDIQIGDITTNAIIEEDSISVVNVIAREDIILCGGDIFKEVFLFLNQSIRFQERCRDGDKVSCGEVIMELSGDTRSLLIGERVGLNILQRLSGIATLTAKYVELIEGYKAEIIDTRKTMPLWRGMERYAVRCGGGKNHRSGLSGGVLIKDNHIRAVGSIKGAIERVKRNLTRMVKIEVEVGDLKEVEDALEAGAEIIMLDNMSISEIKKAVRLINGRVPVEVSGNIDMESIVEVAKTGVDYISVGSLTHSASAVDISMEMG